MAHVTPFRYGQLRRLDPRHAALLERLGRLLPVSGQADLGGLEPIVGFPVEVSGLRFSSDESSPSAPGRRALLVVDHSETGDRAIVEIEAGLALAVVWMTLTGEANPLVAVPRPLDRIEQGVLLYLAARVLFSLWGSGGPLRLVGLASAHDDPQSLIRSPLGAVAAKIVAGPCSGTVQIWLSDGLVEGFGVPPHNDARPDTLGLVRDLAFGLHVVVGQTRLCWSEWLDACPGDVLCLDEIWAKMGVDGLVSAQPRLRLAGGGLRWQATLAPNGDLTVEHLAVGDDSMIEDEDDTLAESPEILLAELPVTVAAEMGRIAMSVTDLLNLRPGQTLRLARRPGDPIDLRVGPKLVGRGELVEIDGELGVLLKELYQPR